MGINSGQARIDAHGEAFTPDSITNKMLDMLRPDAWDPTKTFLDPACGDGNMLCVFLRRKLSLAHDPIMALNAVYGADIHQDNIDAARFRLLQIVADYIGPDQRDLAMEVVRHNVFVVRDTLTFDWSAYKPFLP